MPAGDLLSGDHQVELRAVLFGVVAGDGGFGFSIDEAGIDGLGVPPTKTADTPLDGQDGSFGAPDFLDVRVLTIPINISGVDEGDVMDGLAILNEAWLPASDGVDLELHMQLPGWGHIKVLGRPRGATPGSYVEVGAGWLPVLCRFDCLDPTITVL